VSLPSTCSCVLCDVEARLLASLDSQELAVPELHVSGQLQLFSSVPAFVQLMRASPTGDRSDRVLGELLRLRESRPAFVEGLFILAFVPMLHRSIRQVARFQASLSEEDITQQAIRFLLESLRSKEMQASQSHFAFAIARAVKRQLFSWSRREGSMAARLDSGVDAIPILAVEASFERLAQLRHFLHRAVERGKLSDSELNLLIQFKLEGSNGEYFENGNGRASNALRQRLKRLLSKLRRLARYSPRIRESQAQRMS